MMAGLACCNSIAFYGAILHYIFHAIIKTALFMSAGSIIMQTGKTNVDELEGVGKEMPVTMWGYTLASLGLIGIPPACGFSASIISASARSATPVSAHSDI